MCIVLGLDLKGYPVQPMGGGSVRPSVETSGQKGNSATDVFIVSVFTFILGYIQFKDLYIQVVI